MRTLARECGVFLEIGPHPTLTTLGRHCNPDDNAIWLHSLSKGRSDWSNVLDSLGSLFTAGVTPDWRGLYAGEAPCRVSLPSYPFQRDRFRISRAPAKAATPAGLLGARIDTALGDIIFEQSLSTETPLVNEHVLYGAVILPGARHVSAFLDAAQELFGPGPCVISDVTLREALAVQPATQVTVQTIVSSGADGASGDGDAKVQVFSRDARDGHSGHPFRSAAAAPGCDCRRSILRNDDRARRRLRRRFPLG
jgi:acyl transferase domain-containing protein